jgi:glycosyltransferase involved in cell wall biosynthesis
MNTLTITDEHTMKITFIGTLPPIKALSPYCFHLADALSKKIDLEIITFKQILPDFLYRGGAKDTEYACHKIKQTETRTLLSWYNPLSWITAGIKAKGDIIHCQHWALYATLMYCIILPIAKIRRKKSILTIHNITPHVDDLGTVFLDRMINKIAFPFADTYIVHNQRNKNKLIELYRISENKISIITHGTIKPYTPLQNISKIKAREYLQIPPDKKVLLFFGYTWGYKGLDILLQTIPHIKETIQELVLVIAGQPLKDWKKYEQIIRENNLENHIIRKLEYISDSEMEYYFSCADLVVLPYKKHPFDTHGGVGALALTFKKPMVVTDVGGLPEYVKDKSVIATPEDVNDLSQKITQVLTNKTLLQKLSRDSEQRAKELSWDQIANETINVYEETLKL